MQRFYNIYSDNNAISGLGFFFIALIILQFAKNLTNLNGGMVFNGHA